MINGSFILGYWLYKILYYIFCGKKWWIIENINIMYIFGEIGNIFRCFVGLVLEYF